MQMNYQRLETLFRGTLPSSMAMWVLVATQFNVYIPEPRHMCDMLNEIIAFVHRARNAKRLCTLQLQQATKHLLRTEMQSNCSLMFYIKRAYMHRTRPPAYDNSARRVSRRELLQSVADSSTTCFA